MTTLQKITQSGIIPVFSHPDLEVSLAIVRACYDGGLRAFEYTNRNAQALDNFRQVAEVAKRDMPDLLLGAGTIWDVPMAETFAQAGADFIVSPIMNPAVGAWCRENNLVWSPGCMTVTEVFNAKQQGAELIKVFPGEIVGPAFVRSVKSVLPDVKLMVTGGVEPNAENLKAWFGAGVSCVGMGSQLFSKQAIAEKNWATIQQTVAQAVALLNSNISI